MSKTEGNRKISFWHICIAFIIVILCTYILLILAIYVGIWWFLAIALPLKFLIDFIPNSSKDDPPPVLPPDGCTNEKAPLGLRETKIESPPAIPLHLLKKSGARIGPCSGQQALDMISSGNLNWDDLCWKEGMAEWAPLHTVLEPPANEPPATGV